VSEPRDVELLLAAGDESKSRGTPSRAENDVHA
jgi:hypothetical protein